MQPTSRQVPDTCQTPVRHLPDTFQTPTRHFPDTFIHNRNTQDELKTATYDNRRVYSKCQVIPRVGGRWWVGGCRYIIMPLHGPTYKFARFQAELKFPRWAECFNNYQLLYAPVRTGSKIFKFNVNRFTFLKKFSQGEPVLNHKHLVQDGF